MLTYGPKPVNGKPRWINAASATPFSRAHGHTAQRNLPGFVGLTGAASQARWAAHGERPMKRLILLRHAKAEAKDPEHDFERPLAPRGRAQMKAMAGYLAEHGTADGLKPDVAFVSPAARTRETWTRAKLAGTPMHFEPRIYEASTGTLLAIVRAADPEASTLALVGHNPGFEELADKLVGGGDPGGRAALSAAFPTGALAVLDFEVLSWSEIGAGKGRLERFVTPAALGVGKDG